jgi:hypothetical protein
LKSHFLFSRHTALVDQTQPLVPETDDTCRKAFGHTVLWNR